MVAMEEEPWWWWHHCDAVPLVLDLDGPVWDPCAYGREEAAVDRMVAACAAAGPLWFHFFIFLCCWRGSSASHGESASPSEPLFVFLNITTSGTGLAWACKNTWVYWWVQTNPQAHGYTTVAFHLRSIPMGIESQERRWSSSWPSWWSKDTILYRMRWEERIP